MLCEPASVLSLSAWRAGCDYGELVLAGCIWRVRRIGRLDSKGLGLKPMIDMGQDSQDTLGCLLGDSFMVLAALRQAVRKLAD